MINDSLQEIVFVFLVSGSSCHHTFPPCDVIETMQKYKPAKLRDKNEPASEPRQLDKTPQIYKVSWALCTNDALG